jgi:DNA-binding beta-propeller fold protein YncE
MNFLALRPVERGERRLAQEGRKHWASVALAVLVAVQMSCRLSQKALTWEGKPDVVVTSSLATGVATATVMATVTVASTATATVPLPAPATDDPPVNLSVDEAADSGWLRQGAFTGYLDAPVTVDVAVGDYDSGASTCGDVRLAALPQESGEAILTLEYLTPVLPERLTIYAAGVQTGIRRIEMLNSQSGLGMELDLGYLASGSLPLQQGACGTRIDIPAHSEFDVDRVILALEDNTFAAGIAAVVLYGGLAAFTEPAVYWRVPLPDTPVDIAMGPNSLVYVATQSNGLYVYDVEGNLLKKIDTPNEGQILGMAVDPFGNLALTGAVYPWFVVLSPEGVQQAAGGDGLYTSVAVNPRTGNVYLLGNDNIAVYTSDTAEAVDQFHLNAAHVYTSLAFDSLEAFYLLRDFGWDATIVTVDSLMGEEQDAFPLARSRLVETLPNDLATDEAGNIYVLFAENVGRIAIHQFSQNGGLLQRFGRLTGDDRDRPDGSFLDPRALAVSPDGRFVLVADGSDDQASLTCFLMEIDE